MTCEDKNLSMMPLDYLESHLKGHLREKEKDKDEEMDRDGVALLIGPFTDRHAARRIPEIGEAIKAIKETIKEEKDQALTGSV